MKKLISLILISAILFTCVSAKILPREDIPIDSGAQGMAKLGILKGTESGYELEREVTRAEALTFIWRTTGIAFTDIGAEMPFEDVKGHWAEDTILKFYINGYINGTSETTFEPQRTVSGKEFVKILLTVMGYEGVTIENAFEKGIESELITNNFTETVVHENFPLLRSDVTRLCHSALVAKCADGEILYKKLIDSGAYTNEDFEGILFSGTPAKSYFADEIMEGMPEKENYMFSPLSIKMALALAANGAEGDTLKEISEAAEIYDISKFNDVSKSIIEKYNNAKAFDLKVANSIWINKDKSSKNFSENYKNKVADFYGAEADVVGSKDAALKINNWVSDKTNNKITQIIDSSDFWAALVNAVYFSGNWVNEFNEGATYKGKFTNFDGTTGEAEFMNDIANYMYFADENTIAVEIPYKNTVHVIDDDGRLLNHFRDELNVSMYVMMTENEEKIATLENIISLGKLKGERINLHLPKFKIETSVVLNDILKKSGIIKAFDVFEAEFDKMFDINDEFNMYIDSVLHKTYINVDEKGTEAAAVTAIMMAGSAMSPKEPTEVKFDRPFTFVIRDNTNNEILFAGEYISAK